MADGWPSSIQPTLPPSLPAAHKLQQDLRRLHIYGGAEETEHWTEGEHCDWEPLRRLQRLPCLQHVSLVGRRWEMRDLADTLNCLPGSLASLCLKANLAYAHVRMGTDEEGQVGRYDTAHPGSAVGVAWGGRMLASDGQSTRGQGVLGSKVVFTWCRVWVRKWAFI